MRKKKEIKPEYPKVKESFNGHMDMWTRAEPSAINGVSIIKYRHTVEIIPEPIEVYHERLQWLWDRCEGSNKAGFIRDEAKKYDYTLIGDYGNKIKQK